MRRYLTASASIAALMLLAAPADAYQSRVCYAIQQGSFVKWDCGHDPSRSGGVPDFSRPEPSDDSDDDDDDDSEGGDGDGDGDGDHDCKDGGGKGGNY